MNRQKEEKIFKIVRYISGAIGLIWAIGWLRDGVAMIGLLVYEGAPENNVGNGIKFILGAIVLGLLSFFTTAIYNYEIEQKDNAHIHFLCLWYLLYKTLKSESPKDMFPKIIDNLSIITDNDADFIRSCFNDNTSTADFNRNILKLKHMNQKNKYNK